MFDVIIIGNGPAGISAAIYTSRASLKTLVIGKDEGALSKAEKVENYYGFETISGSQLISNGVEQARSMGAEILLDEIVGIAYNSDASDEFVVKTKSNEFFASNVILATGLGRNAPKIGGILEYEGRGISYCAICDAFFYTGKNVAVFGSGSYAVSEALELLPIVKSVTIITSGKEITADIPDGIAVNTKEISAFVGTDRITGIEFKDLTTLPVDGIFIALGVAGSGDLARKLGAEVSGNKIIVNPETMSTNVPGLYAAGDCTGGMLQIVKASYEGSAAGMAIIKRVRDKNRNK